MQMYESECLCKYLSIMRVNVPDCLSLWSPSLSMMVMGEFFEVMSMAGTFHLDPTWVGFKSGIGLPLR